ncbi:transposase [Bibersteinia trehalosi]|nr:transposase [Bibersteinia trehalosi]
MMNKRKIIRLQHYDYSQNGLYFITICINHRLNLLGRIQNNTMQLNNAGKMIDFWYGELEKHFKHIRCLDYIIMPNHIHFILWIDNNTEQNQESLFTIIQWFKTMTTNDYIRNVKSNNWQPFEKKLWQRSYYEHIIRNEYAYKHIQQYIENNPYTWENDELFMND